MKKPQTAGGIPAPEISSSVLDKAERLWLDIFAGVMASRNPDTDFTEIEDAEYAESASDSGTALVFGAAVLVQVRERFQGGK